MKYIHIYNTREEYNASSKEEYDMSLIVNEDNLVVFHETTTEETFDYTIQYFTIEIISSGDFTVLPLREKYNTSFTSSNALSISYSLNNEDWITTQLLDSGLTFNNLSIGDKIRFKGTNTHYCNNSGSKDIHKQWYVVFGCKNNTTDLNIKNSFTSTTAYFNVYGNIMSLLYGDNFIGQTTLPATYTFCSLFKSSMVVSCEHLILPATTLLSSCYRAMFSKAIYLTVSPVFSVTSLVTECYKYMFEACASLTKIICLAESGMTTTSNNGAINSFTTNATNMDSIPSTGIFIKSPNTTYSTSGSETSWSTGTNGIPKGWTIIDYSDTLSQPNINCLNNLVTITYNNVNSGIYYRFNYNKKYVLYTGPITIIENTRVEAYVKLNNQEGPHKVINCTYTE